MSTRSPLVAVLAILLVAGCTSTKAPRSAAAANGAAETIKPPPPPDTSERDLPTVLLDADLGSWQRSISTREPRAQAYFDQGLRLLYAFNHEEAIRAFTAGAEVDPHCAICWWGAALAHGPNINLPMDEAHGREAWTTLQRAVQLREHANEVERALIDALARRYEAEPRPDRATLDHAYADAMREVARRFPADADVQALFGEALLDLRPWDQWSPTGDPKPGTLEAIAALERALVLAPEHPGANHYYIHAVEASPNIDRALPAAARLQTLMPGAGHLVHMPSHVYIRTGRYREAATANERAVAADRAYFATAGNDSLYAMMYGLHNVDFLRAVAIFQGNASRATAAAREVAAAMAPEMITAMPDMEIAPAGPILVAVAFARWEEVLAVPEPPAEWLYTRGILRYARGVALAARGQADAADTELAALDALIAGLPPGRTTGFLYTTVELLAVARAELAGQLALRAGHAADAIPHLELAVELQDALRYNEPPPWYHSIRTVLGAALLAAGRPDDAESIYRDDLRMFPDNGWSLFGLGQALRAQGRTDAADSVEGQFREAWREADVELSASVL